MSRAKSSSKKSRHPKAEITFRHNFLPALLGLFAFVFVLAILNGQWLSAQWHYRFTPAVSAAASSPVLSEKAEKAPTMASELTIPTIDVNAPIVFDETSFTEWKIQIALRRGVVHYGTTALPGQVGNVVIIGHSSGQIWAPGDYKFIFTLLDKVKVGEVVYIDYNGVRYTYQITGSEVVQPSNFAVIQPTNTPQLTLITCTPVGTSKNRLVIHAKQISPNPRTATMPASHTGPIDSKHLPK